MTRVEQAAKGLISDEVKYVADKEGVTPEHIRCGVADGSIVISRNKNHDVAPLALGGGTTIKINANIGTSSSKACVEDEIEKMKIAVEYGANAIMDLSTAGDTEKIREMILAQCAVNVGTVPLYEMALKARQQQKSVLDMGADELFEIIETHCRQGIDFLTLHCGVTQQSVRRFKEVDRLAGAASRGGTIMMEWIDKNRQENPLYEHYDRLLELLAEYDVAVSLGDGFRPGAIHDATDRVQIDELVILGELVKRARQKHVGVFVEGPGHVPLNQVVANMQIQKRLCENAPFYVLGPLVTDISPGYDHISAAIGGALAAMSGADFLCYVTPAEHLRLPTVDDVREGVVASRIAAHAADIARGNQKALAWDDELSRAKMNLDWDRMISLCIDPRKAREYRDSLPANQEELCSMCGEFCAIKRTREIKR
ncbi:MAG: phosphomethylpyrimidine synthase ThiC [Chitinivibrionales bacterium]|nr:phosphomethylpyrimidine synthase ThiC [Chitinivibrionales bacterium]